MPSVASIYSLERNSFKSLHEHAEFTLPEADRRLYRAFTLQKNDIQVLLISDPELDRSGAAVDVGVGYFSDPVDYPGLAHFLEHMLFQRSQKYPNEAEYMDYLGANGGSTNAYTSTDNTNYFFEIAPAGLLGAVDRLAQFFIHPLMRENGVEREVNAVNNENLKNLKRDARRELQVSKMFVGAPWNKFSTGSKETLFEGVDSEGNLRTEKIREELLAFHGRFYSSNAMKVVVMGRESLDELTEVVAGFFEHVENFQVERRSYEIMESSRLGRMIYGDGG